MVERETIVAALGAKVDDAAPGKAGKSARQKWEGATVHASFIGPPLGLPAKKKYWG